MQNGILSADRTPQPESAEVKYVYQSIWFNAEGLSQSNTTVSVYNEFRFTDLSEFDYDYELLCNGKVVDSGSFTVSGGYDSTVEVTIPYKLPADLKPNSEILLTVYARLKDDTLYAEKGHVVASEQFAVAVESSDENAGPDIDGMNTLSYTDSEDAITVIGDGFTVIFDKDKGNISEYKYNGEVIISNGPVPNFRRAQVDNEGFSLDWDGVKTISASSVNATLDESEKFVTVTTVLQLSRSAGTEEITYTVYGGGEITVSIKLNPSDSMGEMRKFGSIITLPGDYEYIQFYGNGPLDTYCDRLRGSHAGIWNTTVDDSFFPYPRPQDTGVKTGVRYFSLTSDQRSTGVVVVSEQKIEASALHVSVTVLDGASNTYKLAYNRADTYLNVDYGSRGTGGASCGPDVLPQYRLENDGRDYSYTYTIVPFDKNTADLDEILRTWHIAND